MKAARDTLMMFLEPLSSAKKRPVENSTERLIIAQKVSSVMIHLQSVSSIANFDIKKCAMITAIVRKNESVL